MAFETWHTVHLVTYGGKPFAVRVQFEPRRGDLVAAPDGRLYEVTGRTLRHDGTALYHALVAREAGG